MDQKPLPIRFPTDAETAAMVRFAGEKLADLLAFAGGHGVDIEFICRFSPLGKIIAVARERHGLSVRDAARRSGLRQMDVRAIETSGADEIAPGLIGRYAIFLGLGRYLSAWREANPKLAARWSAAPAPKLPPLAEQLPEPELQEDDFGPAVMRAGSPAISATPEAGAFSIVKAAHGPDKSAAKPSKPAAKRPGPTLWQMKVTLRYIQPPIWRRIVVPDTITLGALHAVIQITMGWTNSHLHAFTLGDRRTGKRFGVPSPDDWTEVLDEEDYTLASTGMRPRGKLHYEYDFGDGWEHDIVLEKVLPHAEGLPPRCIDGQRACPPEDCGSYPGYMHFCEVAADRRHPEYDDLITNWHGDPYDPEAFDAATADRMLAKLFKPRAPRKRSKPRSRR